MRHDKNKNREASAAGRHGVWAALLLALVLALCSMAVQAKSIPFAKGTTDLEAHQPLSQILPRFFREQGLQVVLSDGVASRTGTINGHFSGSYASVWRHIAQSNNLVAYYDGSRVYVYLASERETGFTSIPTATEHSFVEAIANVGWRDSSNRWSLDRNTGLITIHGVPRFVQQVKQMAGVVSGLGQGGTTRFKFYPLKYASAADTTMTVGNHQVVIPGVASVLRALVGRSPDTFRTAVNRILPSRQQGLRGSGLANVGSDGRLPPPLGDYSNDRNAGYGNDGQGQQMLQLQRGGLQTVSGNDNVRIVADSFRNAVIVRDSPERLPMYDQLIKNLDVPQAMVEIEATIIDVDKGKLRQMGVNWYYKNGRTSVGFATGDNPNGVKENLLEALGANESSLLNHLFGFQLGAILGDPAHFIARINALESDDIAHVLTRPQVITMNNVPAVIQKSETIYVPVSGAYNSDLYNVVAGTTLRVTPHVVNESGTPYIRLQVQIADGGYELQKKDAKDVRYPVVHQNVVNTRAVIQAGQGLLLGGMVLDSLDNTVDKVPVLGDIPLLGWLFKHKKKERKHVERLFLITPRLVVRNRITGQMTPSSMDVSIDSEKQLQRQQESEDAWWNFKPRHVQQPKPLPEIPPRPLPAATGTSGGDGQSKQ